MQKLLFDKKKRGLFLALIFASAALIRILLSFLMLHGPIVVIDESLFTNIARSLAWEGKLLYRGQPVKYPYVLYPLFLVPVYRLSAIFGGDVYRWVQIYNTLLICSSVFPAFLLARDFTSDMKSALFAAAITLLMPDMQMGSIEMSEAIIWPMSLWMMLFAWRMIKGRGVKYGVLTGLFAGLLFACKPGAIAMGAGILVTTAILAPADRGLQPVMKAKSSVPVIVERRDQKRLASALAGILTAIICVAAVYAVYVFVFGYEFSFLGLYQKQTSDWELSHLFVAIEAFFLLVLLFAFACGGFGALLPYTEIKRMDSDRRVMVIASTVGLIAAIAGTAFLVTPYKWDGNFRNIPLHTRYIAMYVPVWLTFSMSLDRADRRMSKGFLYAMLIFTVLSIFPGVRAGFVTGDTSDIDSMALAAFLTNVRNNGTLMGGLLTAAMVVFGIYACIACKKGFTGSFRRSSLTFLVCALLLNNICNCVVLWVGPHSGVTEDSLELNEILLKEEEPCLGVTQRYYNDIHTYWQESHLNRPMQQVTTDQIVKCTVESDGFYVPFVPIDQSPNKQNGLTPDTETFVLGQTVAQHLELSSSVKKETTTNGIFTVARIDKTKRWVDSMMYGLDFNTLSEGKEARVFILGDRDGVMTVSMYVRTTAADEVLSVKQGDYAVDIEVPYSRLVTFDLPTSDDFNVTTNRDCDIVSYFTENK